MEQNIAAGTRYVTALMWEFHGDLRLVAAAYYAGDRGIAREQLDYRNPDVVAYVQAVRRQYMLRKYPAVQAVKEVNPMKLRWLIPIAVLLPLRLSASRHPVGARVATITINPREVTVLHLRPEFESTIRMPEEITSVILGSPGEFKAEHNEGEPEYVYVKPITKEAAQSNLLIATKSGQHVTLELVSDGAGVTNQSQPVDFLIEYRAARSFLISADSEAPAMPSRAWQGTGRMTRVARTPSSAFGAAFESRRGVQAATESECSQVDEMGGQADRDIDWRHAAVEQRDRDLLLHPEQLE